MRRACLNKTSDRTGLNKTSDPPLVSIAAFYILRSCPFRINKVPQSNLLDTFCDNRVPQVATLLLPCVQTSVIFAYGSQALLLPCLQKSSFPLFIAICLVSALPCVVRYLSLAQDHASLCACMCAQVAVAALFYILTSLSYPFGYMEKSVV